MRTSKSNKLAQSRRRSPILLVLTFAWCALSSAAQALIPPPDGGYPSGNTAEGQNALLRLTTGSYNTAVGYLSLESNLVGALNTAIGAGTLLLNTSGENTAIGVGALLLNTTGSDNTANGVFALANNNTGFDNTATGVDALLSNIGGESNTANGVGALEANTDGDENTAIGVAALEDNTVGTANTAAGVNALLSNTAGDNNTAVGRMALFNNSTGADNIALGDAAGVAITTGTDNIDIGASGVTGDTNTIRIGDNNLQAATYIGGIAGQTVGAGGTTCYVDNDGKLGVFLSARRYKENIQRMDEASAALYSLKPVTFRYKAELDKSHTPQFGLIAEEVAEVSPDLVTHNAKGELSTVRYEAVNAMLLNEFLKEHRAFIEEQRKVQKLEATVARQHKDFEAVVNELKGQIQKVSAQVELTKSAPQTVLNNH